MPSSTATCATHPTKTTQFDFKSKTGNYPVTVYIDAPTPSTTSTPNSSIQTQTSTPANRRYPDKGITLILLPAIGVARRKYRKLIASLTAHGYHVVSADYPCCGDNTPPMSRQTDYDYNDIIHSFIPSLIRHAPTQTVMLFGHSLGGHMATLYATTAHTATATHAPIAIICVATGNIHYKNWTTLRGRGRLLLLVAIVKTMLKTQGYFAGDKIGFGDKEAKGLMQNWCHTALTGRYDFIDKDMAPDMVSNQANNQAKGLYIHIKGDDFAPYASTCHLAELCNDATVITVELADNLTGNPHGAWLKDPEFMVKTIERYLVNNF